MVQRKGNLPVKDGRSLEGRAQEAIDIMTSMNMARVPTAPPARGDLPLHLAEGTGESVPEVVSLSQTHLGTKFGGGKAPTRAGQYPLQKLPVGVGPEGHPVGYYLVHSPCSTSDLLNLETLKGTARCVVCQKNNPKIDPLQKKEGKQDQGQRPFEDWQIDYPDAKGSRVEVFASCC